MRLDLYVSKLENISRNKASELIKNAKVFVDNKCISKPSFEVCDTNTVEVKEGIKYVSRAGEKLDGFLASFPLEIKDKTCLDIGSSTGGFVQVLLQNGAKKVVGVDVGKNQLHDTLRDDEKIELYEQTDIRSFVFDIKFDIITCDVSFIAFKDIAKSIDMLSNDKIIILFKPQFEVGKGIKRDKKGVVCDQKAIQNAMDDFESLAQSFGWVLLDKKTSILKGKEGNLESFYAFEKR